MNKRFISLLTALALIASVLVTLNVFADDADVEISTLAQLEAFRDDVNNGNTYEGKTVKLTADIDMSGKYGEGKESWTKINTFSGTFDGNDHLIDGLYISTDEGSVCFFGYVEGTIKNLNIKGFVETTDMEGEAAGIAGTIGGVAMNCTFDGTVKSPECPAGGITSGNSGIISGCTFKGKVEGMHLIGGIAGTGHGIIVNCINEGEIIGTGPVGGIAGAIIYGGKAMNCINKGSVTGKTYTGWEEPFTSLYIGGIAGEIDCESSLDNCYNMGAVLGNTYVGGILGAANCASWQEVTQLAKVENCYNIGNVASTLENDEEHYIGGVIGSVLAQYTETETVCGEAINCYYLTGTANKGTAVVGENGTDTTTALTTEQLADKNNFTNWDFDTVWEMDAGLGRPVLRSNRETPTPTVTPTPTPTGTPMPTPILIHTPEPSDRIELTQTGDSITANLIFGKTTPPPKEDICLYIAYFENGILKRLEMPFLKADMTAECTIPEQLKDCDIFAYAWDKDMKPLIK